MGDEVKVKFLQSVKLANERVRVGDVRQLNASEARYLYSLGWVEIVGGDASIPKDVKPPQRGLLFR